MGNPREDRHKTDGRGPSHTYADPKTRRVEGDHGSGPDSIAGVRKKKEGHGAGSQGARRSTIREEVTKLSVCRMQRKERN